MSDVPAENRFAYLVVVKTGARVGSGTTSDIVIRLFGKENISQEHVINFPDPLTEYLQSRQDDYFVLASPVHLGKLEKINVWFDCTGTSPTWFCKNIRICDLQTKDWFFFKINKWFEVDGEPKVFMSIPATTDREKYRQLKKSSRLLQSFLSFGRFDKTMWQISTRTTDRHFEYPKRLTVILSLILTINTIALELMGRPDFTPRDAITRQCYFKMSQHLFHIGIYSAILAFFPHIGIIEGFKHSRIQFEPATRQSNPLSPAFTAFFWGLLSFNIILQLHIILIYGYRVIAPETWEWLVSATFGSLFYIFILDYVYNMFIIIIGGPLKPVKLNFEKIIRIIEGQRRILYKLIGHYIYRPILGPVYGMMSKADYARIRVHFRQKREMVWQVNDFFMIISFILLLYAIILGEKDAIYDFRGHTQALNLIEGSRTRKIRLVDIDRAKEVETYIETSLIPVIQSYVWYGKYVSESPGMTTDSCNKYMGVIRIRQQRIEEDSCLVVRVMRFLNITCRTPGYFFRHDFLNYTPAWNNTIPEAYSSRLGYVWGYQEGIGKVVVGLTGYYESGGYVANLGRTIKNSYVNFNYLKRYKWLDPLTRAVIVELCLYNVNKNLFHFVEILLERSASGFINKQVTVQTERVVKHSSRSQQIALFSSLFFMILIVALTIRTVIRIIKTRVWYKRDLWHIIDVLIVALSLVWIVYHFRRLRDLAEFVKNIEESPNNTFVNYFPILWIAFWMRTVAAFLICLSTLRMWRILRFGVIFRTVERTILLSAHSLCIMSLYIVIILFAFGVVMYCALGSHIGDFRNVYFVSKTLLLVSLGFKKPTPESLAVNERGLGYTSFVIYSIVSKFLITVFVAIIIVEYIKARQFAFEEVLDYNLKDYARERYEILKRKAIILSRKFRLTAGGKISANIETVKPKDDSLRYKNCVQIDSNKLKAMASVAKCVLLKIQKGLRVDETDHALMWKTVRNLHYGEDSRTEFFFIESLKDFGFIMVDDHKLLLIEEIVRRMLHIPDGDANEKDMVDDVTTLRVKNMARMKAINYKLNLMRTIVDNIKVEA